MHAGWPGWRQTNPDIVIGRLDIVAERAVVAPARPVLLLDSGQLDHLGNFQRHVALVGQIQRLIVDETIEIALQFEMVDDFSLPQKGQWCML